MDITESRQRPEQQARIADLLGLISTGHSVLDIGARDGYITRLLVADFEHVTALDRERPEIADEKITAVAGDVTALDFSDDSFETVVCAEVLEHIPSQLLQQACKEIARVASRKVVIGVPYQRDTRVGRTTCNSCGKTNPPWGHLNAFDEHRLRHLFRPLLLDRVSFVGENRSRTNALSAWLMNLAGNPYGTYHQDKGCVHCGAQLTVPAERKLLQKVFTKAAVAVTSLQQPFVATRPNWVHALFIKQHGA